MIQILINKEPHIKPALTPTVLLLSCIVMSKTQHDILKFILQKDNKTRITIDL